MVLGGSFWITQLSNRGNLGFSVKDDKIRAGGFFLRMMGVDSRCWRVLNPRGSCSSSQRVFFIELLLLGI